ncbi:hypothetical protein PAMA_020797 [Pampus argenteus]
MAGRVLRKIKERVRNLQLQKAKQHLLIQTVSGHQPLQHVKEGRIHQQLNHFSRQDVSTFPQRFFVNEAYWQRPDGPVFLFIGGEGPIYEFDVLAGHHVDMAEEHGALLLALEHRFYGDSINPDGLKMENLADLSSQQAVADLAVFHEYISQSFNLSRRNTWISFGGSYSGALSAWFRGKFPHLVYGAVASSAPVKAMLDFSAYNNIVGLSLMNEGVGGSGKCVSAVRRAFAAVEAVLMGGNASKVSADFGCCQIAKDPDDQIELMQNLADIFMGTVQYNEEGVLMSIHEVCGVMTNGSEAETKLCPLLFGISQHSLPGHISFTNTYYGGDNPPTHRVLYINGGIDPWQELSVVQDRNVEEDEAQTIFIKDTAHCADMTSRKITDRFSLKKAKQEIEKHVARWLKTAAEEKMEKRTL